VRKLLSLVVGFPLLFGCCANHVEDADTIIISPAVLDFGRVRPTDSPVLLSFDIENRGQRPLEISDILSGCGCTVVDFPQEPILQHQKKSVAVKVNLYGRSGDFANKLRILAKGYADNIVEINGTVITDVWYNGQSIKCSAERGEAEATTVFTLSTRDFPGIEFDWNEQSSGMSVREIARKNEDGLWNINFCYMDHLESHYYLHYKV